MDFNDYQKMATSTSIVRDRLRILVRKLSQDELVTLLERCYDFMGLAGEAGELCNEMKKVLRDDHGTLTPDRAAAMYKELGDVQWYVANCAGSIPADLKDVAASNIEKLRSRLKRGVVGGSGSDR
jgi:NTP pyrophosphatase (non-canonical NTP hydrolase)